MIDSQVAARTVYGSSDAEPNGDGKSRVSGERDSLPQNGATGMELPVDLGEIFIGQSAAMREVRSTIAKVASTKATVMVLGESGTEKELVAQTLHALSPVAQGPFVPVSMATIAADALEAQLFGDEQDPVSVLDGDQSYFALAQGGTLFLDEIAELGLCVQPALLRFLQTGLIQPVGARNSRRVDVRLITATAGNPANLVKQKRLCEDLYYRLQVVPIHLPPLRERAEDMGEIAESLLKRFAVRHNRAVEGFTDEAIDCLRGQWWPGNLHQLENVVERAVIFAKEPLIRPLDLPREMLNFPGLNGADNGHRHGGPSNSPTKALPPLKPIQQKERAAIVESLEQTDGHVVDAAELLGLSQATMYRKIKEYQIVRQRKRRKSKSK